MDSVTHLVIGASVGEVFFERGFGKKAMFWGMLAQSVPDLDFLAALWMTPSEAMLAHRGFSHSILFAVLIVFMLSVLAERWHRPHNIRFSTWLLFFSVAVGGHLLLDSFNNYGIGWFEPFSHHRFAFNWIYVFDPFFLFIPFIVFFYLLISNPHHLHRRKWAFISIILPLTYLAYCGWNKHLIHQAINKEGIVKKSSLYIYSTPAPFQPWLWFVVLPKNDTLRMTYRSVFDPISHPVIFNAISKNDALLKEVDNHESIQRLIRFSDSMYVVKKKKGKIVFCDVRFGQIHGWSNPNSDFVFEYQLNHDDDSRLMIQRGRVSGWNEINIRNYFLRIFGSFPSLQRPGKHG